MEITKPSELPSQLKDKCEGKLIEVIFTQWEDDDLEADETNSHFVGYLIESTVLENKLQGLDGCFHFQSADGEEVTEILMDFPLDEEDVIAVVEDDEIQLFGNESTLTMKLKKGM